MSATHILVYGRRLVLLAIEDDNSGYMGNYTFPWFYACDANLPKSEQDALSEWRDPLRGLDVLFERGRQSAE